jgi:hypothetical protein
LDVMPDQLNKQSLINLLIDSPLREPIKINLIDIINNTTEPDLPKVYSTITKELEIFQKATERRMKLAEETIAKLSGTAPTTEAVSTPAPSSALPPLDLPPMPAVNVNPVPPVTTAEPASTPALSVPPLDLPPLPQVPATEPTLPPVTPVVDTPMPSSPVAPVVEAPTVPSTPNLTPLGGAPMTASSDEAALAEIQKELDSLKTTTASEISSAAAPSSAAEPAVPVTPPVQQ